MDKSTIGGLLLVLLGMGTGLVLEGGRLSQIIQPTAALIVFAGTVGAVMVQFPLATVRKAALSLQRLFREPTLDSWARMREIVIYSQKARRRGIVSLDSNVSGISDTFLRRALMMAIDGTEPQELRDILELELEAEAESEESVAKVFECAGGFAPTIGIIGAVLGLIQVMQHLGNMDEVGKGIAVAFVATIYGVGSANLFFLPAAGKLKLRLREDQIVREMTLEGIVGIAEGTNSRTLESKLVAFLNERQYLHRSQDASPAKKA